MAGLAGPPPQLLAAQRATLQVAADVERRIGPGMTERAVAELAEGLLVAQGATGFWTTNEVGAGEGNLVCHPDHPPTDRSIAAVDLVVFDLTPDFGGWPGDVARSVTVGDDAERVALVNDCRRLEQTIIAAIEPGMPASQLFHIADELFAREGVELLDLLANIGHDLGFKAEVTGYIDRHNDSTMWGAWAIEPHVGRDGIGAKFEDLVWIEKGGVTTLSRA